MCLPTGVRGQALCPLGDRVMSGVAMGSGDSKEACLLVDGAVSQLSCLTGLKHLSTSTNRLMGGWSARS